MLEKKTTLIIILMLGFYFPGFFKPAEGEPATIIVPIDFSSIQAAINAANQRDIVFVKTGVYHEHVIVNKTISLIGEERTSTIIDGDAFGNVLEVRADNVTVANFTIRNSGTFLTSDFGIWLWGAHNCLITENNVTANGSGIWLTLSSNNNIIENIVSNNNKGTSISDGGIVLQSSSNNIIAKNIVTNNKLYGIQLREDTHDNVVYGNYIEGHYYGCKSLAGNLVYHNNFIENTHQIDGDGTYDYGYPEGGNYYNDYNGPDLNNTIFQNTTGSDGIGDTPYIPDQLNPGWTVKYPLMAPITIFNVGTWNAIPYYVDVISNSTLSNLYFNPAEGPFLRFDVSGDSGTSGFCRVTIPKDLLWVEDGWIITVGDQLITAYRIIPDENYTYLYFTYTHSTQTVTIQGNHIIPEFSSFFILPIFMMTILLVAIAYRRKRITSRENSSIETYKLQKTS